MSDEQINLYLQIIQQQIAALQRGEVGNWEKIEAVLEELHLIYEQMQTSLEVATVIEEELLQQNQQLAEGYHRYRDLFQSSPIAYLVTDANGIILEANGAIAQLLNVPRHYLPGKPLLVYVREDDRRHFRIKLSALAQAKGIQVWQTHLDPRDNSPLAVELQVAIVRNESGAVEELRIGVYQVSQSQQQVTTPQLDSDTSQKARSMSQLPQSLDGLQVLLVDDEADAREFVTFVLESYGIEVRAVSSAVSALEALKQFRPDVLLSDIRMPGGDGYSLIRQIRTLEAQQGGHLPAAAITAYQDEDREKALKAGYEAHLHKLAQPNQWVEMVAHLAEQASNPK